MLAACVVILTVGSAQVFGQQVRGGYRRGLLIDRPARAPPLAARAFPYVVTIALIGTAAQIVRLLVYGVNEQRWKEQAGRAAQSIWA